MIEPECTCGEGDHWISRPHARGCARFGLERWIHLRRSNDSIICGRSGTSLPTTTGVTCRDCLNPQPDDAGTEADEPLIARAR